tara:strand:+ start:316 stop:471 length:156 start_codon:yes stop_codon:yes gene_type:complete
MDTNKWKSVLVPVEVYNEIKDIAKRQERSISGQLRIVFREWVEKNRVSKRA